MECTAEFVDGSYGDCGCPECDERWYESLDTDVEYGNLDEDEAYDKAVQFEQFGVRS